MKQDDFDEYDTEVLHACKDMIESEHKLNKAVDKLLGLIGLKREDIVKRNDN